MDCTVNLKKLEEPILDAANQPILSEINISNNNNAPRRYNTRASRPQRAELEVKERKSAAPQPPIQFIEYDDQIIYNYTFAEISASCHELLLVSNQSNFLFLSMIPFRLHFNWIIRIFLKGVGGCSGENSIPNSDCFWHGMAVLIQNWTGENGCYTIMCEHWYMLCVPC